MHIYVLDGMRRNAFFFNPYSPLIEGPDFVSRLAATFLVISAGEHSRSFYSTPISTFDFGFFFDFLTLTSPANSML